MAEPGSSALHLLSTPAHLTCPAPISSHYYSCLSSWMGNNAVPIPTGSCWGGRGREAWDEGKGQHSREEKDAGAADPWLTEGRDRNLQPCRGTSPGGKMLSKHLSLAASPRKAFAAVHERCLPCDTDTFSPLQEVGEPLLLGCSETSQGSLKPCMIKAWLHHLCLVPQSCPCRAQQQAALVRHTGWEGSAG